MRTRIELRNSDDTILCTIDTKTLNSRPVYDIKDSDGNLISRAKRNVLSVKGSMRIYGLDDDELYKVESDVTKTDFTLTDSKMGGKIYATITKADKWRSVFLPSLELGNEYVVRVEDPEADRLVVLSCAVIIEDADHGK